MAGKTPPFAGIWIVSGAGAVLALLVMCCAQGCKPALVNYQPGKTQPLITGTAHGSASGQGVAADAEYDRQNALTHSDIAANAADVETARQHASVASDALKHQGPLLASIKAKATPSPREQTQAIANGVWRGVMVACIIVLVLGIVAAIALWRLGLMPLAKLAGGAAVAAGVISLLAEFAASFPTGRLIAAGIILAAFVAFAVWQIKRHWAEWNEPNAVTGAQP